MSIPNEALQKVSSNTQPHCPGSKHPDLARAKCTLRSINPSHVLTRRFQLLQEIEARAIASQQQISLTKSQMTAKQRDVRMLQLTSKELSELPAETGVYEGVGKM